jgi:TatD DNase family protein
MLIDAHSHLDRYDLVGTNALAAALKEINEYRIFTVANSMDIPSYERNVAIAEMCDLVLPAFGVHPWNAPAYVDRLEELDPFIKRSPLIGEIGLDYHFVIDASEYPLQRKMFEYFLTAAKKQGKIVNLHTKGAEKDVLDLIGRYDISRAIVHWYSGPLDILQKLMARGLYFTIGVEVLYSKHIQTIAKEIPLGQLLTETDNPGGPEAFTGGPGMPVLVKEVVQAIAELKKCTVKKISETVRANLAGAMRDDAQLSAAYSILSKMAP